jgi:hypothetical protein
MKMLMENAVRKGSYEPNLYLFVSFSSCSGYYLATLEAAIQHILDIATQYEGIVNTDGFYEETEDLFDLGHLINK